MQVVVLAAGRDARLRLPTEEVPWDEASRYGVCNGNAYGEITELVEKPDEPESNLVMTGGCTFTPAIFHACTLVHPSNHGAYELSEAVDMLIRRGRTIGGFRINGWRSTGLSGGSTTRGGAPPGGHCVGHLLDNRSQRRQRDRSAACTVRPRSTINARTGR